MRRAMPMLLSEVDPLVGQFRGPPLSLKVLGNRHAYIDQNFFLGAALGATPPKFIAPSGPTVSGFNESNAVSRAHKPWQSLERGKALMANKWHTVCRLAYVFRGRRRSSRSHLRPLVGVLCVSRRTVLTFARFCSHSLPNSEKKNPVTFWATGLSSKMEQAKRLELSTSTLARWCSTN